MLVVEAQVLPDRAFQLAGAPMRAAPDLFESQSREPPFDQVDPRGAGGGEVDMKARPLRQPAFDRRGFVRAVVIHDQMHVEIRGHVGGDGVEKYAELPSAMAAMTLPDDLAAGYVERRKQRGRSMAYVVVRPALDLPRAHRQQGLSAIERLDLRLLIHAQDQSLGWRVQIQSHDVAHLFHEQRVGRELKGLGPMRLEREGPPNPVDPRGPDPARLG